MNPRPRRVPARYAQLLLDALAEDGLDAARVLAEAQLHDAALPSREAWLPHHEATRIIAAAERLSCRGDLGFALGRRIRPGAHGLLGYGLLCCRDLDEALRLAQRHYHLMSETFRMDYRVGRRGGEVTFTPTVLLDTASLHFHCEVLALALHSQLQATLGPDLHGFDCRLSMPEPPHLARYAALSPARFHFEDGSLPGVQVCLGQTLLERPFPLADARVVQEIDTHCSALGHRPLHEETDWGEYITMLLRQAEGDFCTLDVLARRLDLSPRTIERRLQRQGLCFRDIAQRVRFERARELLELNDATVAQVACRLGFRDAANFSRAFRREVGVSPSEYRQRSS